MPLLYTRNLRRAWHGGSEQAALYHGGGRLWSKPAAGDPVDLIPGLVWSSDTPIISTETGPTSELPVFEFPHSGTHYMCWSFNPLFTDGNNYRNIYALSKVDGMEYAAYSLAFNWGRVRTQQDLIAFYPTLPLPDGSRETWESWATPTELGLVTEKNGSQTAVSRPDDYSTYANLRWGHEMNWGTYEGRRNQTVFRARMYDRIPTEEERATIRAWVTQ